MFCREQSARLNDRRAEIEATGARLIAIGSGHAHWARAFIEDEGVEFPVYVDPGTHTYEHFGMQKGLFEVFNPKSLLHSRRARAKGFTQTRVKGDGYQNGGVVVVDPTGEIIYRHVEQEAGDLADLDEVIAALS